MTSYSCPPIGFIKVTLYLLYLPGRVICFCIKTDDFIPKMFLLWFPTVLLQGIKIRRRHLKKQQATFRKRTDKLRMNRLLGWWSQNAPASSAYGARRAVLGRKRLLLTPAAVCASPQGKYQTAIAPILTQKQLPKTAAWGPAEILLGQAMPKR